MKIWLLLFLGFAFADPQIYWLKNCTNTPTHVPVEIGGNLYLASNDKLSQLQNIKITNGDTSFQLDQLQNVNGIRISSYQLTIQVDLDQSTATNLTGFLYATSAVQANDNNFYVTVVNGAHTLTRTDVVNSTTVVLNTQFYTDWPSFDVPQKTTAVKEIQQFGTTELNFHHEIPGSNYKSKIMNNFFENPLYYHDYDENNVPFTRRVFFPTVEPMQVNLPFWYITANGPYSMQLSNTFDAAQTHNTSTANVTGVFVLTDAWVPHYVNFSPDNSRAGTTGLVITTQLEYNVNILFISNQNSRSTQSYGGGNPMTHGQVSTNMNAATMSITPTAVYAGTMYCQYFVFTGDLLPTTSSIATTPTTTTTTTTVATTTKSATCHNLFISILVLMFFKFSI